MGDINCCMVLHIHFVVLGDMGVLRLLVATEGDAADLALSLLRVRVADWKIYYLSICYAILQFGITAIVYFNPFIVGERTAQL